VDRLRQHLLAGAGLAGQKHRHALSGGAASEFLGLRDGRRLADIVLEGEARAARLRQLPLGATQFVLELVHPRDQRLQAVEMIEQHEADGADDAPVLVLDRHARHHELLAAEFHDVEQDRLAGFDHAPHQAVGDDLLDRAADRFRNMIETERRQVFFVDVDHLPCGIDGDGAFAERFQPLEQALHGAGTDDLGVCDDGPVNSHAATVASRGTNASNSSADIVAGIEPPQRCKMLIQRGFPGSSHR
jgi:hypothetical protein